MSSIQTGLPIAPFAMESAIGPPKKSCCGGTTSRRPQAEPSEARSLPLVQDFLCVDCGMVLRNRREDYHHRCPGPVPASDKRKEWMGKRDLQCSVCEHNRAGICTVEKLAHPDRECSIEKGVRIPYAKCRFGRWPNVTAICDQCGRLNVDLDGVLGCRFCGDGSPRSMDESLYDPLIVNVTLPNEVLMTFADRCVVTVVSGAQALELAEHTLPRIRAYAQRVGADMHVITNDLFPDYPLANKFRLCNLTGSKQYLFLDIDVWLRDSMPDVFKFGPGIWMHDDRPFLHSPGWLDRESERIAGEQGRPVLSLNCYNSGVVLFDDPSIWEPPANPFAATHTAEQSWVEYRCDELGHVVNRLPTELNTQAWFSDFMAMMSAAHVVHLANMDHADRLAMFKILARQDA